MTDVRAQSIYFQNIDILSSYPKFFWITDQHFDALSEEMRDAYFKKINQIECPIFLTGDIADGILTDRYLLKHAEHSQQQIYFVLGNHDFYGFDIDSRRSLMNNFSRVNTQYTYLTMYDSPIALSASVALIGHDGWYDGLEGDFSNSTILSRDYSEIDDFRFCSREEVLECVIERGAEAKEILTQRLTNTFNTFSTVFVLTHFPPFRESCLYNDKQADNNWAPHCVAKQVGAGLRLAAQQNPEKKIIVLCGHSHHESIIQYADNLIVITGASFIESGVIYTNSQMIQ